MLERAGVISKGGGDKSWRRPNFSEEGVEPDHRIQSRRTTKSTRARLARKRTDVIIASTMIGSAGGSVVSNRPTLIQISWAVLAVSVTLGWLTVIGWVVERVAGLIL
jgi:hypothetical protein